MGYLLNHVAHELREALDRQGMTQSELAARLGLPPASVSRTLSGEHNLTVGTLERYAAEMDLRARVVLEPAP
jgi:transcriptional regulator with XRE-family HTH domain